MGFAANLSHYSSFLLIESSTQWLITQVQKKHDNSVIAHSIIDGANLDSCTIPAKHKLSNCGYMFPLKRQIPNQAKWRPSTNGNDEDDGCGGSGNGGDNSSSKGSNFHRLFCLL
jgi:hypothetical protein